MTIYPRDQLRLGTWVMFPSHRAGKMRTNGIFLFLLQLLDPEINPCLPKSGRLTSLDPIEMLKKWVGNELFSVTVFL
jgi:hypothetical protein